MQLTDTQLQIIRQSSLNRAVDMHIAGSVKKESITKTAEYFTKYIIHWLPSE